MDYDFLNNYIDKIIYGASKVDDSEVDDNEFYNTSDDDEDYDDGTYSFEDTAGDDISEEEDNNFDSSEDTDEDSSSEPDSDQDDYYTGSAAPTGFIRAISDDEEGARKRIVSQESQGNYRAYNPKGGGAGAVGKYQFRWNQWKDSIQKVTGVKSKEQFLNNPAAQEKYYGWYERHYLFPEADKLQQYNKAGLSRQQLAELVHFRGAGGARKYLKGRLTDRPEAYNVPISQYIGKRQMGGMAGVPMAMTPSMQRVGLNDPSFGEMYFPMTGVNTFRGLDDGTPVYLEDETGKKKILKHKKHTTKMTGGVYEKRLSSY